MIKVKLFEGNENLMVTYSTDEKKALHKVGTDEVYDEAVDVIEGFKNGKPYCRFTYEEVDKIEEEKEEEEQ